MSTQKYLSSPVKKAIISAVDQGRNYRDIARQFGTGKSTIADVVRQFRERNNHNVLPKSGRPRKTTARQDKALINASKADPRKSAVTLNAEIKEYYNVQVSTRTTKRRLNDAELFGRRPVKKPFVSVKNRNARIKFAKEHLNWTREQWSKVLWSDESKFMLFGSDGIKFVRRPKGHRNDPKYQLPTVKHGGGNVMVWGCFRRDGVGPIHQVTGIMDKEMYKDIINRVMLPHAKRVMPRGWIFQQDNDPKHTSKVVKEFFKTKKIRVLEWPSQSPDLNPIEHLWEHVERQISGRKPTNQNALFTIIKDAWEKISIDVLIKLVDSMPRRCQAVIDAKGFPTKY